MNDQPIKLSNFSLYSGDIITLNNSSPLLVEIIDGEKIRLRKIDKNEYLAEHSIKMFNRPLKFTSKFDKSLVFAVKNNDRGEISLQTNNEYLKTSKKDFHLSSQEK
jgi:hypothetical protein